VQTTHTQRGQQFRCGQWEYVTPRVTANVESNVELIDDTY